MEEIFLLRKKNISANKNPSCFIFPSPALKLELRFLVLSFDF